jgi:hypothetical protein
MLDYYPFQSKKESAINEKFTKSIIIPIIYLPDYTEFN